MKLGLSYLLLATMLLPACASARRGSGTDAQPVILGSTSQPPGYYDNARRTVPAAVVAEVSTDASYGFTQKNPVCVGGVGQGGARHQQRYLNALRGPHGEEIRYRRLGSCCAFKTPNALIGGMGLLDAYELTWAGNDKPLTIYLNLYDQGPLRIPVGLTAAQP